MPREILTIGHSNHSPEGFQALLERAGIEVLVDVRSQPSSRYAPHFNEEALRSAVITAGRKYLYLGNELGGRPQGSGFYDTEGFVLYDRVAASPVFRTAVTRLLRGSERFRVAIMCSEENPEGCHRRLLIGRVLGHQGVVVNHIRGDGRLETEAQLVARETPKQVGLFGAAAKESAWKSIRSVLPNTMRSDSLTSFDEHESAA